MRFELALSDFRGFHRQHFTPIRPITVLVGENSAGKTSYLAACKYVSDFLTGGDPSFTADPFQLGTFEQIAHTRGGRGGRARQFTIRVRSNLDVAPTDRFPKSVRGRVEFSFDFENVESAASLKQVEISAAGVHLRFRLVGDNVRAEIRKAGEDWIETSKTGRFFPSFAPNPFRYLSFILRTSNFLSHASADQILPPNFEDAKETFDRLISAFGNIFRTAPKATSAIRTKPNRTYTPGTETVDGEGSHVPYELAKLWRKRNKQDWERVQQDIESFGSASGMFQDLSVKSFGQTASDPFQLQFASSGPKMNIMDLGYGTSQVLPLLFDSSNEPYGTTFLIQQPEVHLHARAQAELGQFFVSAHKSKGHNYILETHSDFIVDRIRLAVRNKIIDAEDVSLLFFERKKLENAIHHIVLNEVGDPISPPDSYRSFFMDEQMSLLGL